LKCNIVVRIEEYASREKLMNKGTISLHLCQYNKKELEDHLPWTMIINGSPSSSRWVMPLIQNEWPEIGNGDCVDHKPLH